MTKDNRHMIHEAGEGQQGQMGRYQFSDAIPGQMPPMQRLDVDDHYLAPEREVNTEHTVHEPQAVERVRRQPQSHDRSFGDKLRTGWKITKATVAVAGALLIAREVSNFGFSVEAHQKAEVTVGPAESVVRENVYVNLAEVSSTFPLEVQTSLDRPGPANCDVSISMNKAGHEVTTVTNTGLTFDTVESRKEDDGTYQVDVSGDMHMTPSFVDWTKTPILFDRELAGLDLCFNMDEPNSAMNIAVVTTQLAGQLATACAVGSDEGEKAIINGIKQDERVHGDIPADVPDEQIKVNFPDLEDQQDAVYGRAVQSFDHGVDAVIGTYLGDSDDHEIDTNFDGIRDCSQHTFTFEEQK